METPVCLIVGAGPGNGLAFARRFAAGGYTPVLWARDAARLQALAAELPGTYALPCDVRDGASVATAYTDTREQVGPPQVIIYNAGAGAFGGIEAISAEDFSSAWQTNALGLFHLAQTAGPDLLAQQGKLIVIGATASLKAGAAFTAFASAKAAQRALAASLARAWGPQGVHVGHVVIDGVIDSPRTRAMMGERPDTFFMQAADIAEAVWQLCAQPRSAWSFEIDLRPFGERW